MALSIAIGRSGGRGTDSGLTNYGRPLKLWLAGLPAICSVLGDSKDETDEPRWSPYTCRHNSTWYATLAMYSNGTLQCGNTYAKFGTTTQQVLNEDRGFTGPGEAGKTQIQLAAQDNSHVVFWKLSTNVGTGWPGTDAQLMAVIDSGRQQIQAAGKLLVLVADTPGSSYTTSSRRMWELHNKLAGYAARTGCGFLVQGSPLLFKKDSTMNTATYGGDGVHPSGVGHALIGAFMAEQWRKLIGFDGIDASVKSSHSDAANDPFNHALNFSATSGTSPFAPTVGTWTPSGHTFDPAGIVSDQFGHFLRFPSQGPGQVSWAFAFNSPSIVAGDWWRMRLLMRGDCILDNNNSIRFQWNFNWKTASSDLLSPYTGTVAMISPSYGLRPVGVVGKPLVIQVLCKVPVGATGYSNQAFWIESGTATGKYLDVSSLSLERLSAVDAGMNSYLDSLYLWKS